MTRIDTSVARNMLTLKAPDFGPFISWLFQERAEALEELATAVDEKRILRLQGKVQFLKDLLDNIEKSDDLLEKLVTNRATR